MKILLVLLLLSGQAAAAAAAQPSVRTVAGSSEAKAFIAAYGQPTDAVVTHRGWPKVPPLDLARGTLHVLPNPPLGVEESYFTLFVRAADGRAFLMRQGGFSGQAEFFGPVPLNGR